MICSKRIAFARHACLAAVVLALAALEQGCGGVAPRVRTAAVIFEPSPAGERIVRALESRGVAVAPVPDPPPAARDRIAEARVQLARAVEAQQSFREGEAIDALARAERLAADPGVGPDARPLLAQIGLLRAWLHLSADRRADAEREVGRALAFADPGTPDPAAYPPELVALVERVARAPAPTGMLRIAVRGSDRAQVWIDGRDLGLAPVDVGGIAVGSHFVRVEAPGFVPIGDRVEVPGGGEAVRTYTLAVAPPGAIAATVSSSTGPRQVEAARRLARALGVDGVLLGRAPVDATMITADWVPRSEAQRRVAGRGSGPEEAADDLARAIAGGRETGGGSGALLWIVAGTVGAALAVGAVVLLTDGGESDGEANVRCCDLP